MHAEATFSAPGASQPSYVSIKPLPVSGDTGIPVDRECRLPAQCTCTPSYLTQSWL
jgi:hypothetical protein